MGYLQVVDRKQQTVEGGRVVDDEHTHAQLSLESRVKTAEEGIHWATVIHTRYYHSLHQSTYVNSALLFVVAENAEFYLYMSIPLF